MTKTFYLAKDDITYFFVSEQLQGLASYCKAETTFTFHFSILALSNAFLSINIREMKNESGFSLVMASQPFVLTFSGLFDKFVVE